MTVVAIHGLGYVGRGMHAVFPDARCWDPAQGHVQPTADADLHIICVPTPRNENGTCDTSVVESAVRALPVRSLVLVKSTVPPGTCRKLAHLGYRVVFSPEYMGEGGYHVPAQFPDPHSPLSHGFMVLGGNPEDCSAVIDIFMRRMGPSTRFRTMSLEEAETVKYFENAFLGLKVVFANEMRRFCEQIGVNYHAVREGWLDDPRVGTSHSAAFSGKRYFDGKCLPKDISALRAIFKSPLLEAVHVANEANKT